LKKVAVGTAIVLLILFMFLCFYKNEAIENIAFEMPIEKTEIRIAWNWENDDVKALAFKELMRKFEDENPDINLKYEYLGNSSFYTNLQVDFASGNETDLVSTKPGYTIGELITRGKITSLPYDEKKHSKEAGKYISGGNVYGISLEKYYSGLLVNYDLLESLGLAVPKTYDELLDISGKLKEKNIIPISCSLGENQSLIYQSLICGFEGSEKISDCISENCISDGYLWGLEAFKELYSRGVFSADALEISDDECIRRFKDGEAAMLFVKSGHKGKNELMDFENNTGLIPFPPYHLKFAEDTKLCSLGDATFYWSKSRYNDVEKQDILQELFEFIINEDNVKFFSENAKVLSYGTENSQEYEFLNEAAIQLLPWRALDELKWYNCIEHKINNILLNEIEPAQVIKDAETGQKGYGK